MLLFVLLFFSCCVLCSFERFVFVCCVFESLFRVSVRCVCLVVCVACLFVPVALFMFVIDSIVFVCCFFSLFAFCWLLFRGVGFVSCKLLCSCRCWFVLVHSFVLF